MKSIHEFLAPPAQSCKREGPHVRIVMSSRVRLARNLKAFSFPGWAKKADRVRALEVVRPAVESLAQMDGAFSESMDNLTAMDKQILVERHLVSREHAAKNVGSALERIDVAAFAARALAEKLHQRLAGHGLAATCLGIEARTEAGAVTGLRGVLRGHDRGTFGRAPLRLAGH